MFVFVFSKSKNKMTMILLLYRIIAYCYCGGFPVIKKRLTVNVGRLKRLLNKYLPDLIIYEPSSEYDLTNLVYALLKLKGYNVSDEPEPVIYLGKSFKPDLVVEDQVAVEIKIAKTKTSAVNAIKQAEAYRKGGYPASIAIIYTLTNYEVEKSEVKRLEKKNIHVVLV